MITLKDVMNSNSETTMLKGTTEEMLAKGLIISHRDMMSHVADINDGIEVESLELFLIRQQRNITNLLSLLDQEVVYKMLEQVQEDTKKRVRK